MITRAICRVLVGREDELSRLEDALLRAVRGEGSVVVLAGDAGMGKSRLCSELRHRAERIGAAVLEGSCSEAELALPYLPFLEAIGNHLGSRPVPDLRERLGLHARELARVFPALGTEDPTNIGIADQPDTRLRLFEAILALLDIAAEVGGLLLIVEDLHWADASTRELLDYLTRRLLNTRVLLLATYRRDEMHRRHPLLPTLQRWQRSRLAELVELEPLPPAGVAQMVSSIFDDANVGSEFRDFMHQRSEGNPFVIEEMLKAAIDRGDIYRADQEWERRPISELRIPETVRDTILLRVERLPAEEGEILRSASVLGRSFDYQTLLGLSARDRSVVENALQTAVQQQLLEEEPDGRGGYRFRHALTQEAIYEDLSAPARERLHGAAADVIGARPGHGAEVALHLRAANRWAEAIPATLAAAAEAEARFGYQEAVALYSVLLPALAPGLERARLLCRLGHAHWLTGSPGQAVDTLEEGIRVIVAELGESAESAHFRLVLGRCLWEQGSTPQAREQYEAAVAVLEDLGPSADLALGYTRLSGLRVFDLDGTGGRELAERAIAVAEAAGAPEMRIWAQIFLGLSLAYLGDLGEGIRAVERCVAEAEQAGLPEIAGNALHNLMVLYINSLQIDRMEELVGRLRRLPSERWGAFSSQMAEMIVASLSGDPARALEAAEELRGRARQAGSEFYAAAAGRGMAISLCDLGRAEEARQLVLPLDPDITGQELIGRVWIWLRFHLQVGDLEQAAVGADLLLRNLDNSADNHDGFDAAVEVLVRLKRLEDARRLVAFAAASPLPLALLIARLGAARIALAVGDTASERAVLADAAATLERARLLPDAVRAGILLARVDAQTGDGVAAARELHRLRELTRSSGLISLHRLVVATLVELGLAAAEGVTTSPPAASEKGEEVPSETGERLVTVMFADVRGYTAMTADTAPAEMVERIATYQRWAAREVESHLGVVDKFAGDAVMATFNVSGTHVDHAEQALAAALALRDKAALLGLPVGIGIASGAAVVGHLTTGANLSVLGETTNLAARLQSEARPGEVLLSAETHRRLRQAPPAAAAELTLKGFDKPVRAYRLQAGDAPSPAV